MYAPWACRGSACFLPASSSSVPPGTCSSPGSPSAAGSYSADCLSALAQGVDITLLRVSCSQSPLEHSRFPEGFSLFLTMQTQVPLVQASPQRISCNHPGVSLLKSRSLGVFHVSLWEFLLCWRFCFVAVLFSTCKANLICFISVVSKEKTLPHNGCGVREARTFFSSNEITQCHRNNPPWLTRRLFCLF